MTHDALYQVVEKVNSLLADSCTPTLMIAHRGGSRVRAYLRWGPQTSCIVRENEPNTQCLTDVMPSHTLALWLTGFYQGLQTGLINPDFSPDPECTKCKGGGFCACQIDHSDRRRTG